MPEPFDPIDPDVDLQIPQQRREWTEHRWVLPTIAAGGALGAAARHGLEILLPVQVGGVPWATLLANVVGSFLIGLLMVHLIEHRDAHPLVRPFAGVGVLGGFTTFSAYAAQSHGLWLAESPFLATGYVIVTPVLAVGAVFLAHALGRAAYATRQDRSRG